MVLTLAKAGTFYTVPHVVLTPHHKIISLRLLDCHFATVRKGNLNICYANGLGWSCPLKGVVIHRLRTAALEPIWSLISDGSSAFIFCAFIRAVDISLIVEYRRS